MIAWQMLEAEIAAVVGPKGKHQPERTTSRHGTQGGSVVLGGRKVKLDRTRTRTKDG